MSTFPTFFFETTADEVATAFSQEIKGKNVLITGTSINGIGFETARVVAKHANLVIITGYDSERLKLSEEAIKKDVPTANVRRLTLDLASLAAVRTAAAEVNTYAEPLHVLINNAAAIARPTFKLTADGLELQMATGHIGPFLFTKLLVPKLLASATDQYTPRVVYVSSIAQSMGTGVNFDTIKAPTSEKYNYVDAYCQVKAANVLSAVELSRQSGGKINAYSLHPGHIFTNINQTEEAITKMKNLGMLTPDGRPNEGHNWKTIPQGAATTVAAAFDPRLNDQPGAYLVDSAVANQAIAPHCSDPVNAQRLWNVTEEIIGERFEF
ncbi:Short-chain dehydrogenase/reductase family protein [Mycena venus]|uniref:Short-chain dehydrogenase/reductase family protein n=1 Tax=Mycena venus TaxID=2733690 RepID=A0A8H7DB97_9AGAR|nr:Short-chain dehydrogenase/reductase family protein [Mycena venus]